jgi:hypothetical protein
MQARQRLGEKFLKALADDFDKHGVETIEKLRVADPARYTAIVASLMPKSMEIAIENRGPMDSDAMRMLRRLVDTIEATGAANVADSETVLNWMEEDLRARLAVPVDRQNRQLMITYHRT